MYIYIYVKLNVYVYIYIVWLTKYYFICGLLYAHAMGSATRSLGTTWLPPIFIQVCSKLLGSTSECPKTYFAINISASSSKFHIQRLVFLFLASLLLCCWIYHQLKCSHTWKTYICWIGHEVVPHWPTGMQVTSVDVVDGMRCQVDWAPPNHHKPSRCFWVLRTDGSQDGVLDGLGSMVIPSNCFAVTGSFTSGLFFRGFFGFLCMIWPPLTTVPFVPVWPVASNLPNVLYNCAKGPIVKCIGVVFLQEFAIVQLIFLDMPLLYDKSG